MRQEAVEAARRVLRVRPDRAAPVQPHVRDHGRPGGGGGRGVPAAGDGAGDLHQLQERRSSWRGGKPPFGIAQVGKSFRNEITPGNFLFRVREFEQMEMEYFVPPARGRRVVPVLDRRPVRVVRRATGCGGRSCACGSTGRRSARTTPRGRATSSTTTRSAGRSSRASPTAVTSTSRATRVLRHRARVRGPGGRRAVRPVRDRARRQHRAHLRRDARRRLRRGGGGRARAYGAQAAPGDRAGEGGRPAADRAGRRRWSRRRAGCTRSCARRTRSSTTRAARSAAATAARTRSVRPSPSRSTSRRSRTTRSRSATATRSPRSASRSARWRDGSADELRKPWTTPKGEGA